MRFYLSQEPGMLKFSNDPDVAEQQMNAIIYYLTAFGYIDGGSDRNEKTFVKIYIRQLAAARAVHAMPDAEQATRDEVMGKFVAHFLEVFEHVDRSILQLFDEVVSEDEKVEEFVAAKLKLRCYEIFNSFDQDNQRELLSTVDELIHADGQVHDAEARFRQELDDLLHAEVPDEDVDLEPLAPVEIEKTETRETHLDDHPFFQA